MSKTQWDSVKGSIATEIIAEKPHRVFRLNAHCPQYGWRSQAVAVPQDRLEKHPWLYKRTLDLLVRDIGVWDPQ